MESERSRRKKRGEFAFLFSKTITVIDSDL